MTPVPATSPFPSARERGTKRREIITSPRQAGEQLGATAGKDLALEVYYVKGIIKPARKARSKFKKKN